MGRYNLVRTVTVIHTHTWPIIPNCYILIPICWPLILICCSLMLTYCSLILICPSLNLISRAASALRLLTSVKWASNSQTNTLLQPRGKSAINPTVPNNRPGMTTRELKKARRVARIAEMAAAEAAEDSADSMTSGGAGESRDVDVRLTESERAVFVEDCVERGVLLEGLVALAVIDDPSTLKVFQSGLSRARFFDSLGDVHTMVGVMREWCNSLQLQHKRNVNTAQLNHIYTRPDPTPRFINRQVDERNWRNCHQINKIDNQANKNVKNLAGLISKPKRSASHTERGCRPSQKQVELTWCELKGLDETVLQRIEASVQTKHAKLCAQGIPAPALRFNRDVTAASSALTSALSAALHARLCVYRGHARLGYYELSTTRNLRSSRNSFVSLLKRAPTFILVAGECESKDENEQEAGRDAGRYMTSTGVGPLSKTTAHVLVNVSNAIAAEMIKKTFGPQASVRAVKKTHTWERFVFPNVGLHCGEEMCRVASSHGETRNRAASDSNIVEDIAAEGAQAPQHLRRRPTKETICDTKQGRIKRLSRLVIDYDRETRTLSFYAEPAKGQRRAKADVRAELVHQQAKAAKLTEAFPFPFVYSPLKLQLGDGLVCYGLMPPGDFNAVEAKGKSTGSSLVWEITTAAGLGGTLDESASHSNSRMFRFTTFDEAKKFLQKMEAGKNSTKAEYTACFRHAMQEEEPVSYNSQVIVNAVWEGEKGKGAYATREEANPQRIQGTLERLLIARGLRVDPVAEDCTRVRTYTDPSCSDRVLVSITFPTSICARQGTQAIAVFEESAAGRSLVVEGRDELSTELRTLHVRVSAAVWAAVRTGVKDRLDALKHNETLLSHYEITAEDQISSAAGKDHTSHFLSAQSKDPTSHSLSAQSKDSTSHPISSQIKDHTSHLFSARTVLLRLVAIDVNCVQRLREAVESALRPTVVKVDRAQWRRLHALWRGELWLRAVTCMTGAHVHMCQWIQQLWVYGSATSKDAAAKLLLEHAPANTGGLSATPCWNLIDFTAPTFRVDAAVRWIRDFEASTVEGGRNDDVVRDWFFDAEYLHVWIKAERSRFQDYIKSAETKYAVPPASPKVVPPKVAIVKQVSIVEEDGRGFDFQQLWGEAELQAHLTEEDLRKRRERADRAVADEFLRQRYQAEALRIEMAAGEMLVESDLAWGTAGLWDQENVLEWGPAVWDTEMARLKGQKEPDANGQKVAEIPLETQDDEPQVAHVREVPQVAQPYMLPVARQLYVGPAQEDDRYEEADKLRKEELANLCCFCCDLDFADASDDQRYVMESCGHVYCTRCLTQTITSAVRDSRLPLSCCAQRFTVHELRYVCRVTRSVALDEVLRTALTRFVSSNSTEYRFCPRADCPGVCRVSAAVENPAEPETLKCSVMEPQEEKSVESVDEQKLKPVELRLQFSCLYCSTKICSDCMNRYHGPTSRCDEESSVHSWMRADQSTRKLCPCCKMGIEKVDGCNNVYCLSCLHYTCWTCSKFHAKDATEVYNHLTKEHGGY